MQTISTNLRHPTDNAMGYALVRHDHTGIYTMFDGMTHRSVDQGWARTQHMLLLIGDRPAIQVSRALGVSDRTVDNWRATGVGHRNPPASMVRLAELALKPAAGAPPEPQA